MDTKDIAILVLGFTVVLLIGWLLGSRKAQSHHSPSNEQSATKDRKPQQQAAQSEQRPKINPYELKISEYRSQCKRTSKLYAEHTEAVMLSPFDEGYGKLDQAYELYNSRKDSSPREAFLDLCAVSYDAVNFGNFKTALEKEIENCAEMIIGGYDETIGEVFSGQAFEKESSQYALTADMRASQKAKICSILQSNCTQYLSDLREIEQRRSWLQSNLNMFTEDIKGEFDWTDAAKHFGAGALAAANPLIGIPALISCFKGSSDKDKAREARAQKYAQVFGEYEDGVMAVREKIVKSGESAKLYMETKFMEVHDQAVVAVLTELSCKGYSLDHFFKFCEKTEVDLKAAEKRIFG
ncbi:MAG: hypothetical protein CVU69_10490 [Deltaproteobacteria bacterium HGW-Deltaproteobacteria-4]|nr:MAG: hypothetical protein CVU69_10490 [Deltaproteobacteria bacterium HGW-Deltaproteobacteria-4]